MSKRTTRFWFKNTHIIKHNNYEFILICDKFGNVLKNKIPDIPEFFDQISDMIWEYSDCITNSQGIKMGIEKITKKKFLKVADFEELSKISGKSLKERLRYPGKNKYLFQNFDDLLHKEETFFNGNVWVFGNLELFNNCNSFIDSIRICVCDIDFNEVFPDEEIEFTSIFNLLEEYSFHKYEDFIPPIAKKNIELSKSNRQKPKEEKEIAENGMIISKQSDKKPKNKQLNDLYSYSFKFYRYKNK